MISGVIKMMGKTRKNEMIEESTIEASGAYCDVPERSVGHFYMAVDSGIVVDVEIQAGDPVDSQFIRNFMGEFEAAGKLKSA